MPYTIKPIRSSSSYRDAFGRKRSTQGAVLGYRVSDCDGEHVGMWSKTERGDVDTTMGWPACRGLAHLRVILASR
jgi:hypothetical protein